MQALSFEEWYKLAGEEVKEKPDNVLQDEYQDYLDAFDKIMEGVYETVRTV